MIKKELIIFALRVVIGLSFLSAVADRIGLWGELGDINVAWGNFQTFIEYTAQVNSFFPETFAPFLAWSATILEIIFGFCLIFGIYTQRVSLFSGYLILIFACAMIISFGVKSVFDYSILTASFACFYLSTNSKFIFSIK